VGGEKLLFSTYTEEKKSQSGAAYIPAMHSVTILGGQAYGFHE